MLALSLFFASCASVAGGGKVKVNAFDTLDQDALVYMRIPVKVHSNLTNGLLKGIVGSDISDKYIKNVTDSIDTVYLAYASPEDKNRLQVACDGSVSTALKLALAQSEYFSKEVVHVNTTGFYPVFTEKKSGIQICSPGSDLVLVSRNMTPQLTKYDTESMAQTIASVLTDSSSNSNNAEWKESGAYKFVGDANTDNVRLYMTRPLSFITNLLGTQLSSSIFKLNYLESEFRLLPSGKYAVDIDMEFSKNKLVEKAAAFLKVALLLTNSSVSIDDDTHLSVRNIEVSMGQLQNMIGSIK